MKKIIGLTGPSGSGKSTLCRLFGQMGIDVIDCDIISKRVTADKSQCNKQLAQFFGKDIIKDDSLDRKLLAERAFADEKSKKALEDIIFPFIKKELLIEIEKTKGENIVLDAPTLYESGFDSFCHSVIALLSSREKRKERIIARDNLTEKQAEIRLSAGKDDNFYIERANHIIYNNYESENEFLSQCKSIIKKVTEE